MNRNIDELRSSISDGIMKDVSFDNQYTMIAWCFRYVVFALLYIGDCIRNK